jgi:citronellol/citronellal dehydrogenase
MWEVNMRGTFLLSQACIPHLQKSTAAHILTLSPPLNLDPKWFAPHVAYTLSKYGMSMCTLGMAQEFAADRIAINCLWPRTIIATAAIEFNFPAALLNAARKPSIMADAAYQIFTQAQFATGQFLIDEAVLRAAGVTDFAHYAVSPGVPLYDDLFLA